MRFYPCFKIVYDAFCRSLIDVDPGMKVERAEAISVPPECKKCGEEAVKIINNSPRWEHATQYGRQVIYQAIQHISWQVED